jgi:hypothetical protein
MTIKAAHVTCTRLAEVCIKDLDGVYHPDGARFSGQTWYSRWRYISQRLPPKQGIYYVQTD